MKSAIAEPAARARAGEASQQWSPERKTPGLNDRHVARDEVGDRDVPVRFVKRNAPYVRPDD